MENRGGTNVPRRIGSAPLERQPISVGMHTRPNHSNFMRGGGEKHSHGALFPQSGGFFDRVPSASDQASSYPANCIYEVEEFAKLHATKETPPKGILDFVNNLWKEMPENQDSRPDHLDERGGVFQGEEAGFPSKVLKDRKIHNEVLGILGRINENNFEIMKKELTNLPIRQSSQEEIQQVIRVFFNKSIQPEDSIFTPLYVKLICHLISTIGEQEVAGRYIRQAIIHQCQSTFDNADVLQEQLEEEVKLLSVEEAELSRIIFARKQKANVNFLGLLFVHDLVREPVVLRVLQGLIYGRDWRRRCSAEYELVHFMELLLACGKKFTTKGNELLPGFRAVMNELIQTHPLRRIQFLLLNTVETMDNGWEPLYGPKAAEQNDSRERRTHPPAPPRNKTLTVPPQKPIASVEDFWQVMDNFFVTSRVDDIVALLGDIPMETRVQYCTSVIGRYIANLRYAQQRKRLGELFKELSDMHVITIEMAREALLQHLRSAVEEDLFTDIPKYFSNWAVVIKSGREVFPLPMHTEFLNILVDNGASRDTIVHMVRDVCDALKERTTAQGRDADMKDRFRILPAVLRYVPPLFAEGSMDESEDILKLLREYDVEVEYFYQLCEQVNSMDFFTATANIGKNPQLALQFISAFFTFVRFDVEALCRMYKDSLKKVINSKQLHVFLDEVYTTWGALNRTPEQSYFQFVKALCVEQSPARDQKWINLMKEQLEKHKTILRSFGPTGKSDANMLDKILK